MVVVHHTPKHPIMKTISNFPKSNVLPVITCMLFLISAQVFAQPSIRLFGASGSSKYNEALAVNASYVTVDREALAAVRTTPHFILQGIRLPQVSGVPSTIDLDLTEFSVLTDRTTITLVDGSNQIA